MPSSRRQRPPIQSTVACPFLTYVIVLIAERRTRPRIRGTPRNRVLRNPRCQRMWLALSSAKPAGNRWQRSWSTGRELSAASATSWRVGRDCVAKRKQVLKTEPPSVGGVCRTRQSCVSQPARAFDSPPRWGTTRESSGFSIGTPHAQITRAKGGSCEERTEIRRVVCSRGSIRSNGTGEVGVPRPRTGAVPRRGVL